MKLPGASKTIIKAERLTMRFGGVTAVDDLSFEVRQGEAFAIVGPNGAGKSTLLSIISGQQSPTEGLLEISEVEASGLQAHKMARYGVALAFQIPKPFRALTVSENISVATQNEKSSKKRSELLERSLEICGLQEKRDRVADSLGLLDLKRLELARAIATNPEIILLDEVAAGLNGSDLEKLITLLNELRSHVSTMVLVEHVQEVIHKVAERVMVLDWGRKIAEGTPAEIAKNQIVIDSYLGHESSFHRPALSNSNTASTKSLLKVENLTAGYGAVTAVNGVSFDIKPSEIIAVIGSNGAGKSTLAQSLMGSVPLSAGQIGFNDAEVTNWASHKRLSAGIAISPEGRKLFPKLSVEQNIKIGLGRGKFDANQLNVAYDLFPKLKILKNQEAGALSGGEQQMVAIGRAIVSNPKLLILDEVSLGLAPIIVDRLYESILLIQSWGTSILLIEQNIHRTISVAHRVLVLQHGKVFYWGEPSGLSEDQYMSAYIGGK
jgi:ABC-type branched-subunit amino acid transport system ATPase component